MGALFLIASAFAFLAAAVFLRLRFAWLCLPLWLALYWYLPRGFIMDAFSPPRQMEKTEIILAHRPNPGFLAFYFIFSCAVLGIFWRTVCYASTSLGTLPRKWSHRFLRTIICIFFAGIFTAAALFFTSMTNRLLLNAGVTNGAVFPLVGYLFYFACTAVVCVAVIRHLRGKNYALMATTLPAAVA